VQKFEPLEGDRLKNWVLKEFLKYNIKAPAEVAEKIIEFIGNDLWRLSNEIRKLVSFKKKPED
jgi:DNA polymerase III delta subunit